MKYEYDVVVIGGGAAGLSSAGMAVSLGAKTAMIEKAKLGGDCTWYGCIPSKSLLHTAQLVHQSKRIKKYGLSTNGEIDFKAIMKEVRAIRQEVYEDADDPAIFEKMGVDVITATAAFEDNHHLKLYQNGKSRRLSSKYFFIATGSRATEPPIPGLNTVPFLTNESLFELETQPQSLTVIGAGPIGIEMAQAFQRLGTQVYVVDKAEYILGRDDQRLTLLLQEKLEKEGVRFYLNASIKEIKQSANNERLTVIEHEGKTVEVKSSELLVAAGRTPNIVSLDLNATNVKYSKRGIEVDASGKTSVSNIYAVGDVTGDFQFTHMAEHSAKVAVVRALLKVPMKKDVKNIPWVTFTDPELAHIGASESDLKAQKVDYVTYKFPYTKVDRAIAEGLTEGWILIYGSKKGKIYGVSILGERAGELISEYGLAMKHNLTLRNIADTIHAYPTYGLGARRAADQWYIKQQSVGVVKWIKRIFGYRGPLPDISDPDRII